MYYAWIPSRCFPTPAINYGQKASPENERFGRVQLVMEWPLNTRIPNPTPVKPLAPVLFRAEQNVQVAKEPKRMVEALRCLLRRPDLRTVV